MEIGGDGEFYLVPKAYLFSLEVKSSMLLNMLKQMQERIEKQMEQAAILQAAGEAVRHAVEVKKIEAEAMADLWIRVEALERKVGIKT